jgi:hypothetical protein
MKLHLDLSGQLLPGYCYYKNDSPLFHLYHHDYESETANYFGILPQEDP